jgi:hypothetical protein
MRATLLSVGREVQGSALVTAITSPSTVLEVDDAGDFSPEGGQVTIGAHTLTYTSVKYRDIPSDGVTVGTLVLSGTAGFSAAKWTLVQVYPPAVEYVAQVKTDTGVMSATVDHPLISDKAFELSAASDPAQVEVEQRREKWYVTHLYDRTPELPALTALSESVDALEIAFAGISGGGGGNVGGGHWGDTYGSTSTGGGHWGDTYA